MTEDIREMIARLKREMAASEAGEVLSVIPSHDPDVIEPANPAGAEFIARQLAALKAQKAPIERLEKQLADALKLMIGNHRGIRNGDVELATITRTHPIRLNVALMQEHFPYEKFPQYYQQPTEEVRLNLNKELKLDVFVDPATGEVTS